MRTALILALATMLWGAPTSGAMAQPAPASTSPVTPKQGAVFNHKRTRFALTGAHLKVACKLCHANNNFKQTSTACWSCHQTDYNGTTNPAHKATGFPQDCSTCHTTAGWTGATFSHASTGFALTGIHTTVQCAQCHINNIYRLTSGSCWNCHQTDYNGTTNPAHKAAGFPQDCSTCHTTAGWSGAKIPPRRLP